MDLDELRTVRSKERRKDSLQHLRDSFYADVADYVRGRKAERDRRAERVENPFSDAEVRRLSDEIETAEEVAEAIYERRIGKVVKLASFAAADMPVDEEGLTEHERDLFGDLVARIGENKSRVLDVLTGERPSDGVTASGSADGAADAPVDAPDADESESAGGVLADAMGRGERDPGSDDGGDPNAPGEFAGGTAPSAERVSAADAGEEGVDAPETDTDTDAGDGAPEPSPTSAPIGVGADEPASEAAASGDSLPSDADAEGEGGDERTTVRITRDVGAIFGVDEREYDLADEDVVSLPTANAEPLIERGAAERLD